MKMTNGQLPTWYVIKRISADDSLYARASETNELFSCTATSDGMHVGFTTHFPDGESDGGAPIRTDWTLYRRGKKEVKPVATNDPIRLGTVYVDSKTVIGHLLIAESLFDLPVGEYNITAVQVES
jgi:hypothetical protein